MCVRRRAIGVCALLLAVSFALRAQTALGTPQEQFQNLATQAVQLSKQGKNAEAMSIAQDALRLAETTFGPEDEQVAQTLRFIGGLYQGQAKWADAERVHQRALAILEKKLGADDLRLGYLLNHLAVDERELERYPQAESLYLRALVIAENKLGPNDLGTITVRWTPKVGQNLAVA